MRMRIVYADASRGETECAVGDTLPVRRDRRTESVAGGLINALDAENTGDFANVGENGFKLAPVQNFEASVNSGVRPIRAALEIPAIGAGTADDGGNFREKTGAIFGANGELNREGCCCFTAPFDGNAAFGLIHQVLYIGAKLGVYGDTATARDVADDIVTGNGITALRAEDE